MPDPSTETRAKRAAREIASLPDFRTEEGLGEIGTSLPRYMAETLVHLIRRLPRSPQGQRIRQRAEQLLFDTRLRHPDAIRLDRQVTFLARALGPDQIWQDQFRDAFTDLFALRQLHSLKAEHRGWEEHFLQYLKWRTIDVYRQIVRQKARQPVTLSLSDDSVPDPADPLDMEAETLRRVAPSELVQTAIAALPAHLAITLELYLDGHPQSGDRGPLPSIQTLLGLESRQAVHGRIQTALQQLRTNPEVARLLELDDNPPPPGNAPEAPPETER